MAKIIPIDDAALYVEEVPVIRNKDGPVEQPAPPFGLCRCGKSGTKPFCDLTHRKTGFSSQRENEQPRNREIEYKAEVEGKQVVVAYNPMLCGHVAECGRLQKAVFDSSKRPWIQPEHGTVEGISSAVRACPSGALRMSVDGEELRHIAGGEAVEVEVVEDGPFVVRNVELGSEFNGVGANEKEYILCRCGQSKNKPFCDGTHYEVKWKQA